MTCRILRSVALIALLAVLPFGGNQRLAGQTSTPRYILCAPSAAVAGIAQRNGLTVVRPLDQHAHDVFLVTGPSGVAAADLLAMVRADSAVTNFEPDAKRTLTETGFGLNQSTVAILDQSTVAILDQSTVAILDALTDRSLVPFGDIDVWSGYMNQPAASLIRLPEAHARFGTGSGVVALIDEGVDPNHTLLLPALVPGYDFTRNLAGVASEWLDLDLKLISKLNQSTVAILDQSTVAILDGSTPAVLNQSTVAILDQSTVAILDTTQVPTGFGHGTMMAGAIRRVAPGAAIMPLKAFNAGGTANLFDVIRAIYFAAENGAKVIVMGFSMPESSVELTHAINFATSKGAVAVAAAGNDGRETLVFPAAIRSVVGVGSTTPTDMRSAFSNYGDALAKVGAPGEAIITSYPGGRFAAASGTSFSAALVGGAVALLQSVDPTLKPADIPAGIGVGAVKGDVLKLGRGRVDVLEALKARVPSSVPPPPPPAPNAAPVAANDMVTVAEDSSVAVDVLANDVDADGNTLVVSVVTTPSHGTAVLATTGADANKITYKPVANFTGVDSFTYTVGDGRATATAAVTVTVTGQNEVPVATADATTTSEDMAVAIDVLANDTDGDGESLTLLAASGAARGTVTVESGQVRYVPSADAVGSDTFSYSVRDTRSGTASGTVTVTITAVNDAPVAAGDTASGSEDAPIVVNVAANDSDVDGDALSVTSVTQGTKGSVAIVAEEPSAGSVRYSPAPNFSGTDSFVYTVEDGNGGTATAVVTVTIASVNDAPVATDDSATAAEDGSAVVAVTANDSDVDNDRVTVTSITQPANGTAAVVLEGAGAGSISYRPAANFSGTDTFNYTIADGTGASATAAVIVTVTSINDAPVAADDAATGPEDAVLVIDVIANDTDADREKVTVSAVTQPAHGTVALLAEGSDAGSVRYTPAANYSGPDQFSYTITDGTGEQATAAVAVTVSALNDQPAAADDSGTTAEDTAVVVQPLANDADVDGDTLTISAVSTPAHGAATVQAGAVTYTPAANFAGADSFTYTIADGNGGSATGTVSITVDAVDDAPVAADDATTGAEDAAIAIDVVANDSDADGNPVTVQSVTQPAHGTVTVVGDGAGAGSVSYTPSPNFAGTDRFTYTVTDGIGESAPATVTITITGVNDHPSAGEDAATTAEDTPLAIDATANDADLDGDALSVIAVGTPANGVALAAGGRVTYTPSANFAGIDSFSYTVADGHGGTASATITVTVSAVDDAPVASDDVATGPEDAVLVVDVVANDRDPDGAVVQVQTLTQPAHGTVQVTPDGAVSYAPAADFAGTDRFTYVATDGNGSSASAAVIVTITALNDSPTAVDDTGTTAEDTQLVIQAPANDIDPDGDTLSVAAVTAPAHGTAAVVGGQVTYTPAANFAGVDGFTYTIDDGNGGTATATISITVSAVDDAPVAAGDVASGAEDSVIQINVLGNDSDPDGTPLRIAALGQPARGSVAIAADGSVSYTPAPNFSGTDTFTYTIGAGDGPTATATVSVNIVAVNDEPAAAVDSASTAPGASLLIDVVANDLDADGDALSVIAISAPANGTAAFAGGHVTYTPAADFAGKDTLSYTITDGNGGTAVGIVEVVVLPANDSSGDAGDVRPGGTGGW